ncbi:MAG: enoyl-CoA hydratase-related protein [Ilumatobacteraceae bacterium]
MSEYQHILVDVDGPVARVTLNRPERMNSMTNLMVRETTQALERLAADERVRVVVLTGAGKHFCPGADLQGVATGSGADAVLTEDDFRTPVLLREMPAVTIALVNGACAGAGFGWALACDLRVATRSARFNSAFLDVGVAGDMSGPWTLPRLVGAAKARELYLIPDKFTADEAHRIGLVARVFDDETFAAEADAVVARLANAAPQGLRTMKANFLDAERVGLDEFARIESRRHMDLFKHPDTLEAFRARVEKRSPVWSS